MGGSDDYIYQHHMHFDDSFLVFHAAIGMAVHGGMLVSYYYRGPNLISN